MNTDFFMAFKNPIKAPCDLLELNSSKLGGKCVCPRVVTNVVIIIYYLTQYNTKIVAQYSFPTAGTLTKYCNEEEICQFYNSVVKVRAQITHLPYQGLLLCHQFGRARTTESSAVHQELLTQ